MVFLYWYSILFLLPLTPLINRQRMSFGIKYPLLKWYQILLAKEEIKVFQRLRQEVAARDSKWVTKNLR